MKCIEVEQKYEGRLTLREEVKYLHDMAKEHNNYFNNRALTKRDVTVKERGEWLVWEEVMNRTYGMLERNKN